MIITNIEFKDIDHKDYPDYCDAYVVSAFVEGLPATQEQIDLINDNGELKQELLMNYLH